MKTYTFTFTEDETAGLANLLDAAVRAGGLATVHAASAIIRKMDGVEPDPPKRKRR